MATSKKKTSTLSAKDTASRAASLATIAKTNPALAKSLSPLATGGTQSSSQKADSLTAIRNSKSSISATDIGTESPVIPEKPVPTEFGDTLGMNNASVLQEGLTLQGGQFVKDETASDTMNATKEANMNLGNIANSMISYLKPEANQAQNAYEDTYGITAKQAGRDYRGAQNEVQQYTSQLNNITASRDAAILGLEDTGRGQTSGFIGGEQGRIQRQAAIAALPVQAQLAAAQGNLEIAKSHVDSLFQMKVKDIETEQAYKNTVANTWMSVANQQQSNLLNAAIADSNARAEEKKTNLQMANQWAQAAFDNGQSTLAAKMMKLDQSSPTFQQDLATLQGQVVNTNALLAQEAQRANIANTYAAIAERAEANKIAMGTLNGKAQTQAEKTVQGYGSRALEAAGIVDTLGSQFVGVSSYAGQIAPNLLKSEDRQKYEQAQRNFINSVLRKESGAVISEEEFANARLQYFPQPGDSAGVMTQKQNNRNTTISNLFNEANVPMPELQSSVDATSPLQSGYSGKTTSGLSYTVI